MKIIDAVDTFRLDRLDIFGKGDSEREVEEYIACKGLQDRVFLKGYTNDLNSSLKGYKGIFAQGRSAIESLAMGYPVVLAGYGKIIGVIDHSNLPSLVSNNFVAGECSECSGLKLESQFRAINDEPGQYNLREEIINKLDVKYVADNYIETLENLDSTRVMQGVEFLSDLRSLADTDDCFYLSKFVYSLLKKYFKPYSYNVYLSSMFTLHDECIALQEVTTMLENNMNKLIQEIEVEKTRSIVTLIKRDLHKITSKFSLK